ncbi:hypothetical protein BK721_07630 [Bacillus thuringiensis serovar nigeriensis]|nr:hypothetical protein BK721_07630 [Bacillus thuringiensis serovar nigeriensis]
MGTFTSIFTKKFMILLISRVRHYLTITLRGSPDKWGSFYSNNYFVHFFDTFTKHSYVIFSKFFSFHNIV